MSVNNTANNNASPKPKISTTERVIKSVPFPPSNKLTLAEVFDSRTNKPKPEVLKQHFILEGRLDEQVLDDLKMRAFWERASPKGMSFLAFNSFVSDTGFGE